jgi:hypothetical protein
MKNYLFAAGVLVAISAIFITVFQSDEIPADTLTKTPLANSSQKEKQTDQNINVDYIKNPVEQPKKTYKKIAENKETKTSVKKDRRVKYQNVDQSRRYGIQVIDEAETEVVGSESISVIGYIDGNRFIFKVPSELKNNDLKLRIVDRKTKVSKIVDIPFVSEIGKEYAPTMHISFANAVNYELKTTAASRRVFP